MSNSKLQVAIRFDQGEVTGGRELLENLEEMFEKKSEYSEFDNNILTSVSFDYVIANETDSFDFDINISKKKIKKIVNLAQNLGFDTSSYKIKILQYDNGGCAGLSEVE